MIKVSVLYPYKDGVGFDMTYYLVEQGVAGGAPGTQPAYVAMGHLLFDTVESFQAAFAPHAATIMADIPNYTALQPIIQISEVKMS